MISFYLPDTQTGAPASNVVEEPLEWEGGSGEIEGIDQCRRVPVLAAAAGADESV